MKALHGVLLLLAAAPRATRADDYGGMLAYLDVARIDGHALAGANGAIAVNQAAGDLNVQANLRVSPRVIAPTWRSMPGNCSRATACCPGRCRPPRSLAVTHWPVPVASHPSTRPAASPTRRSTSSARRWPDRAYAKPTIRPWPPRVPRWQGRDDTGYGVATGTRSAGVASTALRGFDGVLQLNQIAGNGNDTANVLGLVVQDRP